MTEELVRLISDSEERTEEIGEALGAVLDEGDVLLLLGDLGAGKTAFTKGVARGLGVQERVLSPTFVLVRNYQGRLRLVHADLYRLSEGDTFSLDILELGEGDSVTIIEWGDRAGGLFEDSSPLTIRMEADGMHVRSLEISGDPHHWAGRIARSGVAERAQGPTA